MYAGSASDTCWVAVSADGERSAATVGDGAGDGDLWAAAVEDVVAPSALVWTGGDPV